VSSERIRNWWENTRSSLWFIPSILSITAIILSVIIPELDRRLGTAQTLHQRILFYGSPDAARTLLTVIAGSVITVISLLFSITILTLQQASTQFSPRIMRTFMRNPANQTVLGVFVATFLYSILVLRQIREDVLGSAFVPILAMTSAIILAVACLGLLVFYLHNSALMFNAATILENIHHELLDGIDRLYPSQIGFPLDEDADDLDSFRERHSNDVSITVNANSTGYLRVVDHSGVVDHLPDGAWAIVFPTTGAYVTRGMPLIEVGHVSGDLTPLADGLRDTFILDTERSMMQDAMFGFRQLVDIALKAMSPTIFDPTTAEHAISCISDSLIALARRDFPTRTRSVARGGEDSKQVTLWINRPEFAEYVDIAFSQLRRSAREDVHVTLYLLDAIAVVARNVSGVRREPVEHEVREIVWLAEHSHISPHDRALVQARANAVLELIEV
jgi:uncharacterized membrane protein